MRYLRTNTATIVTVGPFYDKTDGVTIETALTITNERITFVVDNNDGSAPTLVLDNVTGATSGTANDLNYITNNDAGLMQLELSAANTNYLGRAILSITDAANHCPVFHEFMILPAVIFDAMIAGTDLFDVSMAQILGTAVSTPATAGILDVNLKNIADAAVSTTTAQLGVNVVQLSGDATAADNSEAFFDGTGYAGTNNTIPTVTSITNGVTLATGSITAAVIATGAIDADAIATGAVTNAKFAAGAIDAAAIADAAIDAATFAAGAITAGAIAADAIGASELAADAASEIGTAVWATAVRTVTAATNITSTGAAVPITAGGLVSADVTAISTDTAAADNAEAMFDGTGYAGGTIKLGVNLVQILGTALTETAGQIAAAFKKFFDVATPTGTANSLPDAVPGAAGGVFIAGTNAATTVTTALTTTFTGNLTGSVGSVTGAVGSVTAGVTVTTNNDKTGYALSSAGIQAIWDALTSALTTVGSIGKLLVDNINATINSRSSHSAADVWSVATRLLTAGTNIVLAKGTGIIGFNDLDAAGIRSAVGLISANLDTQLGAIDDAVDTEVAAIVATLGAPAGVSVSADIADIESKVDDLEGRLTATRAGYLDNLSGGAVATAAALATVDDFIDTEVAAIKAVTDKLDTALEADSAVYRFTENALELAPAGTGGGSTAAEIWGYASRTLTQSAAQVAAVVAGSDITIQRGDTISITLTGLTDDTGWTKQWFTLKTRTDDADSAAIAQALVTSPANVSTDGLIVLNGSGSTTKSQASITRNSATSITIALAAAATATLEPAARLYYDVQMLTSSGVTTRSSGLAEVEADVTRTVS